MWKSKAIARSTAGILALVFLCGCAGKTTLEMSLGAELDMPWNEGGDLYDWHGSGGVVDIALRHQKDRWFCEFRHTSNLTTGWPFNRKPETFVDRVGCGVSITVLSPP